jgi:hypothetical protein
LYRNIARILKLNKMAKKERVYRISYTTESGTTYKANHGFGSEKEAEKWLKAKGLKLKSFSIKYLGWN